MLIPSHRHTTADLNLWAELKEADRLHYSLGRLEEKADRSIKAIQDFLEVGPVYAGTSWGKESTVLCHLLSIAAPSVPLVHLRPTNHNPDCDLVRDAYRQRFPEQPYSEVTVDYSSVDRTLPDHLLDKATDRLWYAAIRKIGIPFDHRHILGIRAGESRGRLIRTLRWGLNSPRGSAPLAMWTTADVYAWLAHYNLPVHPAYACFGSGRWPRERLRVAELGDTHGKGSGRRDWELEYYGNELRRMEVTP